MQLQENALLEQQESIGGALPPEKQYQLAYNYLQDNKLKSSITEFKLFIVRNPAHNLVSNAYFWLGEAYFQPNAINTIDDELNSFLYDYDEDKAYCCEAYFCAEDLGKTIVQIHTANRDDAEKYYDLVSNWATDKNKQNIALNYKRLTYHD